MKDYYIEREVDGHPICFNGCSQTKKEIVNDLNDMLSTITSLYKAEKQLQKDKADAITAISMIKNLLNAEASTNQRLTAIGIECDNFLNNSIGEDK